MLQRTCISQLSRLYELLPELLLPLIELFDAFVGRVDVAHGWGPVAGASCRRRQASNAGAHARSRKPSAEHHDGDDSRKLLDDVECDGGKRNIAVVEARHDLSSETE